MTQDKPPGIRTDWSTGRILERWPMAKPPLEITSNSSHNPQTSEINLPMVQWKITIFNGKIHYFDWAMFNCYGSISSWSSFLMSPWCHPRWFFVGTWDEIQEHSSVPFHAGLACGVMGFILATQRNRQTTDVVEWVTQWLMIIIPIKWL